MRKVSTPQVSESWERTRFSGVNASTGMALRSRDRRLAESPLWVNATTYFAPTRAATSSAALAMTPPPVCGSQAIGVIVPDSLPVEGVVLGGG